jgi:hypothetical protein
MGEMAGVWSNDNLNTETIFKALFQLAFQLPEQGLDGTLHILHIMYQDLRTLNATEETLTARGSKMEVTVIR